MKPSELAKELRDLDGRCKRLADTDGPMMSRKWVESYEALRSQVMDHLPTILLTLRHHDALVEALRCLHLEEALEYEGRLECVAHFSCDALYAARELLETIEKEAT